MSSPFEAFNNFEARNGLPNNFIRLVNATNPDGNAWALLERNDIDHGTFDERFASESAALGHEIQGAEVLALLAGRVRPEMVAALDAVIAGGYKTACLTNNIATGGNAVRADIAGVMARFGHVVESSKVGVRKPEMKFYEIACAVVGVEPAECVFLDDLGVNLKPARAMGMTTIKVVDPADAINALQEVLGIRLASETERATDR